MIACGKCNVWQHVACVKQEDANQGRKVTNWDKVDFICPRCVEKEKKRIARKEKKEEKLRLEALANSGVASVLPLPPMKGKPGRKSNVATNGLASQTHPHTSTSPMSPPMVRSPPYQNSPYSGHEQSYHSPPLQPQHFNGPNVRPHYTQHPQQALPHPGYQSQGYLADPAANHFPPQPYYNGQLGAPQYQHQPLHQQHSLPNTTPFATPYTPSYPQRPGYPPYSSYSAQNTMTPMHSSMGYSSTSSNSNLNISVNGAGHSSFRPSAPHQFPPQLSPTYGQHVPQPTSPTFATNGHPGHELSRNGPNLIQKRMSIADEDMEGVERSPKMLNQA